MFDFDIRYIFDKRHIAIDKFSRKSREPSNDIDEIYKKNIDNFINDQFKTVQIYSMQINKKDNKQSLKKEYSEKFQRIVYYLITLTRFTHLDRKKFYKFKN